MTDQTEYPAIIIPGVTSISDRTFFGKPVPILLGDQPIMLRGLSDIAGEPCPELEVIAAANSAALEEMMNTPLVKTDLQTTEASASAHQSQRDVQIPDPPLEEAQAAIDAATVTNEDSPGTN